jgi:hypothetical protein
MEKKKQANKHLEITYLHVFGHIRGVFFIDNSMSIESGLQMHPSGRNELGAITPSYIL